MASDRLRTGTRLEALGGQLERKLQRQNRPMSYPFRIEAPSPIGVQSTQATPADAALATYMDRLIKLVPAEILGLYLTIRGLWLPNAGPGAGSDPFNSGFLEWWPLLCLALLIVSRAWGLEMPADRGNLSRYLPVVIAIISFVVWVYAIGDPAILSWRPDTRLASTAVVVWVFVVPAAYPAVYKSQ